MIRKEVEEANCTNFFKAAYENRYTWEHNFSGYKGACTWSDGERVIKGCFKLNKELKASVKDISDENIYKAIASQLWEVAIHRIRRSFEQTHGENTFTFGDENEIGKEILVGGKNNGDKYRVKNNVVTMVRRHIHGSLIIIETKEVLHTEKGYLSKSYSSQYLDTTSEKDLKGKNFYTDTFSPLFKGGPWVLCSRSIEKESFEGIESSKQTFSFSNLKSLDNN